jgi:integrase/recombinase XerC
MTRRIRPYSPPSSALAAPRDATFNFALVLPGRAGSRHSQRAYFRWVDEYLVAIAGFEPTRGDARLTRMSALPIHVLTRSLSASQLRAWMGMLVAEQHGKQGLMQAHAAVCTLADLLAEAGWLDDYTPAAMHNVRIPRAEDGQRVGRWLSPDDILRLLGAGRAIATSDHQLLRNQVALLMLCTMALRRDELASARWNDLTLQNNRAVLRVHGKGRKVAYIDLPRVVMAALERWKPAVMADDPRDIDATPILRRIWKGGRVSKTGLSVDGIWLVVSAAAAHAQLGHVAPHDLRRSVAGALNQAGVPIEKISRLLRHSNIAVTEKYLNRLPQANEGARLMSELLGFDELTSSENGLSK